MKSKLQQIDERIIELQGLMAREQYAGTVYQEQKDAIAKCMPVIEELRRMIDETWLPIAQAPKDGTRIIGASAGCEPHCYYFHKTHKQWVIDYADGPSWQPTHWKPMPAFFKMTMAPTPSSLLDTLLEERAQEAII